MSKRPKPNILTGFLAKDLNGDIVTFYKKLPKENNGMFYGDEILNYPESQFPDIQYSNSPIKAYLKDGVIEYKI